VEREEEDFGDTFPMKTRVLHRLGVVGTGPERKGGRRKKKEEEEEEEEGGGGGGERSGGGEVVGRRISSSIGKK